MEKKRKRIVYVDDVNYSLLTVKSRLQRHYEVFPAQSAQTLFEILEKIIPNLILLDINMPEQDGFEIIKELKANQAYASIPVIFLTGNHDRKTALKAMGQGAVDLVTKPFSDAALIERIENQLGSPRLDEYKPVVLAVDDNPAILKSVNEMLRLQYRVYTLPKPELMEALLKKIEPDLFLLDCKMPILSGFDLVPIIRAANAHERTPIIFLTADGTIDTVNAAIHFGASSFIVKPVNKAILLQKLAHHTHDYMMLRHLRRLGRG